MNYNYITDKLETFLDNNYEFLIKIKNKNFKQDNNSDKFEIVINFFNDYLNKIQKWKLIFDEIILFQIIGFLDVKIDDKILIELGYPNIRDYLFYYNSYKYENDDKFSQDENLHIKIKSYILTHLVVNELELMINKYIDIFCETVEITEYEYIYPIIKNNLDIYQRLLKYKIFENNITLSEKLKFLSKNKKIIIISLFIKLNNNLYNKNTFDLILKEKQDKLYNFYNKIINNKNGLKILTEMLNNTNEFNLSFNYNLLKNLNLVIPFISINKIQESFDEELMVYINNIYKLNLKKFSPDFIIYKENNTNKLITLNDIDKIYTYELIKYHYDNIISLNNFKNIIYFYNINIKYIFELLNDKYKKYDEQEINDVEKKDKILINNTLLTIFNDDNVKIDFYKTNVNYICIHELYLTHLNNSKSLKVFKIYINKLNEIIIDSNCKICGRLVNDVDNLIEDDIVYTSNLINIDDFYKYKDFIKACELLIKKFGQIFDIQVFIFEDLNNEHKNFVIQNIINIINNIKQHEIQLLKLKKITNNQYNDYENSISKNSDLITKSSFFIFTITNNFFIQDIQVDKFIHTKYNNIYILIVLLFFIYYNIEIKFQYDEINNLYINRVKQLCNDLNIKYKIEIVKLFTHIIFVILKYKRWYVINLFNKNKITLKERIEKYGYEILNTICDYIYVFKNLHDNDIMINLYKKFEEKLINIKLKNSKVYISSKYDKLILINLSNKNNIYLGTKLYNRFYLNRLLKKNYLSNKMNIIEVKKYSCKIFCKDGNVHSLKKNNFICINCKINVLENYNYKINNDIKDLKQIETKTNICKKIELNTILDNVIINLINEMNKSNIVNLINNNINNFENTLYKNILLKREILKIEIENNSINLSTNNNPIILYWIYNKLMNVDFAQTKITINFNPLGKLFFHNFISNLEFKLILQKIFIESVQKNIYDGIRTKIKDIFNYMFSVSYELLNDHYKIDIFQPITIINNSTNCTCILLNNYKDFFNLLSFYIFILSRDSQLDNIFKEFINNVNDYINSLETTDIFFKKL